MSLTTILLIAGAAIVMFVIYRVGRGSREASHARAAGSYPDHGGEVDLRAHEGHEPEGDGAGRKRHGCC